VVLTSESRTFFFSRIYNLEGLIVNAVSGAVNCFLLKMTLGTPSFNSKFKLQLRTKSIHSSTSSKSRISTNDRIGVYKKILLLILFFLWTILHLHLHTYIYLHNNITKCMYISLLHKPLHLSISTHIQFLFFPQIR